MLSTPTLQFSGSQWLIQPPMLEVHNLEYTDFLREFIVWFGVADEHYPPFRSASR